MKSPETIAILEDNRQLAEDLKQQLSAKNIESKIFSTRQEFKKSIEKGDRYDLIVLDCFFEEPDTSVQAQLVLQDLRTSYYVPVVVYTEERDAARAELDGLERPTNRTPSFAKGEITPEALADRVAKWYEASFNARLSVVWRKTRSQALEQSLYELDALESTDFQRTLQRLLTIETERLPDVDHALDFLERYVTRKVVADQVLRQTVKAELAKEQLPEAKTKQEKRDARRREAALVNAHCYINASDQIARTGDIVEVTYPGGTLMAIVLTPACDLVNAKCQELRLAEAEDTDRDTQRDAEWQLPAMQTGKAGVFRNLLVNFHKTFYLKDCSLGAVGNRLITYADNFEDRFGTTVKLRCICRLDDPYRADLLQKYSSHASRVGVP